MLIPFCSLELLPTHERHAVHHIRWLILRVTLVRFRAHHSRRGRTHACRRVRGLGALDVQRVETSCANHAFRHVQISLSVHFAISEFLDMLAERDRFRREG